MFNIRCFLSNLAIIKNQKLLDNIIKHEYKNKSNQFSLVNYKIKPNSIIAYEKPKTQGLIIPTLPPPLQPLHNNNNIKKNCKYYLAFISVTGLSTITICSYGYLIYNHLELICVL